MVAAPNGDDPVSQARRELLLARQRALVDRLEELLAATQTARARLGDMHRSFEEKIQAAEGAKSDAKWGMGAGYVLSSLPLYI